MPHLTRRAAMMRLTLACLLTTLAVEASAQVPPPSLAAVIEPQPPLAGGPVNVRFPNINPGCMARIVDVIQTRQGNTVSLTVNTEGVAICGLPPPSSGLTLALGSFEPGRYTLAYQFNNSISGPSPVINLPFVVSAVTVASAQPRSLLVLAGVFAAMGVLALWRGRAS